MDEAEGIASLLDCGEHPAWRPGSGAKHAECHPRPAALAFAGETLVAPAVRTLAAAALPPPLRLEP